jgi:hypothetical protein
MFQTKVVEKNKTQAMCSVTFKKIVPLSHSVEKVCRAVQATGDNMAHANSMLDT